MTGLCLKEECKEILHLALNQNHKPANGKRQATQVESPEHVKRQSFLSLVGTGKITWA